MGGNPDDTPVVSRLRSSGVGLVVRSLFWTLALPGLFAGYLPWRYFGVRSVAIDPGAPVHWAGIAAILAGVVLLGACIWEFARTGGGTLSPVDPPRVLVVRGLYRHVRNPMYLSVTMIVLGEVLLTGSTTLLGYWAIWFGAANLFVMAYEEPGLRSRFGAEYEHYCQAVGRWVPRFSPYEAGSRE